MFENLVGVELFLLCALCLGGVIQEMRNPIKSVPRYLDRTELVDQRLRRYLPCLLLLFLFTLFLNRLFSVGRPVILPGILDPGTFLTRLYIPDADPWLRRIVEPSFWLLYSIIFSLGRVRREPYALLAGQALFALLAIESMLLHPVVRAALHQSFSASILVYIHGSFIQAFFALLGIALFKCLSGTSNPQENAVAIRPQVLGIFFFILTPLICGFLIFRAPKFQVGAHYYSWFPENWKAGDVWSKLIPPIDPQLGRYLSDGSDTFPTHLRWAEEYGIDYFVFDWWPQRTQIKRRVGNFVGRELAGSSLKFSFMYESSDLKESGDEQIVGEAPNVIYLTDKRIWRLGKHWEYLAREYMNHPNYLRVEGRPVLFVYTSRHIVGPVAKAILAARSHVEKATGQKLFLIGDEAYYNVLDFDPSLGTVVLPEFSPNWSRLTSFDAITAYNPYDDTQPFQSEKTKDKSVLDKGIAKWLSRSADLYRRYSAHASAAGIPFIPTVLPGYNDRGVRLAADHYVLPRLCGDQESLFSKALRRFVGPVARSSFPYFTITSWNEWNEGTQVEPSTESEPSALDSSDVGNAYTQDQDFCGYGFQFLEELAKFRQEMGR